MNIIKKLKRIVASLIWPNNYDSDAYVCYLRKCGLTIGGGTRFINPKQCKLDVNRGDYISIGKNCCLVTVTILAHDYSWYVMRDVYDDYLPDPGGYVKIGNNCFIGCMATILKDTEIGDNVIIGANSVVKGKVPSNTIWAGVPAKQICTLEEYYQRRCNNRLDDLVKRYKHVKHTKGTVSITSMGYFAYYFLERSNDNYDKYIKPLEFNGKSDNTRNKELFFTTKPVFSCFNEMTAFCEQH